jgi:hypothetical protein
LKYWVQQEEMEIVIQEVVEEVIAVVDVVNEGKL